MTIRPLLVRCDGGRIRRSGREEDIASGHMMRMLNFVAEWQARGHSAAVVVNRHCDGIAPIVMRYTDLGCPVVTTDAADCDSLVDAGELVQLASKHEACAIYVDGYHFTSAYRRELRAASVPLFVQDDTAAAGPYDDVAAIVGGHLHAPDLNFGEAPRAVKLLGPRYALLAKPFAEVHARQKQIPPIARKLLVTFGASDPQQDTERCLRGLLHRARGHAFAAWLREVSIKVVVGATNPRGEKLARLAHELIVTANTKCELLRDVRNISELMDWADIAFSATGGTVLELMCVGTPLALQVVHPVQVPIAQRMVDLGVCVLVGDSQSLSPEQERAMEDRIAEQLFVLAHDPEKRAALAERGKTVVDGAGAARVCDALERLVSSS